MSSWKCLAMFLMFIFGNGCQLSLEENFKLYWKVKISRELTFYCKSLFSEPQWANWLFKFPGKSLFPVNQLSREVNSGKSAFLGSKHAREVNFPGKTTFSGSKLSQEVNSGKSTFPESQFFREVNFSGKSTFLGSLLSLEVNFPGR